jgi:signal transduction histidine kinase
MSMYEFTVAHRDQIPDVPPERLSELFDTAELEPVRVANVLRQLQHSWIPEREISIAIEVDESLYVNADELELCLAVGNLLAKAIRSSAAGEHVVMRCRADDAGVVIEVDYERGSTLSLAFPPARPTRTSSWPPSQR